MKTTTLFILFLIVAIIGSVLLIAFFYFYPSYATMTHSFIFVWLPEKVTGLIAYANQSLAVIGVSSITAIIGSLGLANWLWKRAKSGEAQKQQLVNQTKDNLLLKKGNTIKELTSTLESKDTLISQLQASNGNVEGLVSQVKALEKQNSKLATERNQLQKQMDELMAKWLPQEQKVK